MALCPNEHDARSLTLGFEFYFISTRPLTAVLLQAVLLSIVAVAVVVCWWGGNTSSSSSSRSGLFAGWY
jgi:tetrahydromethanopterin S-methyltransferase subunit C